MGKTILKFSPNLTAESSISCVLKPENKFRDSAHFNTHSDQCRRAEHVGAVRNVKNTIGNEIARLIFKHFNFSDIFSAPANEGIVSEIRLIDNNGQMTVY